MSWRSLLAIGLFSLSFLPSRSSLGGVYKHQELSSRGVDSPTKQGRLESVYITPIYKAGAAQPEIQSSEITLLDGKIPATIKAMHCGKPEPLLLELLIDTSGSRRQDLHLKEHYDAVEQFLVSVPNEKDTTFVGAFNDELYPLAKFASERSELRNAVAELRKQVPRGSTLLYDTFQAVSRSDFAGHTGRRVLVVVSDFSDNSSKVNLDQTLKLLQRSSTTVFAVVDGSDAIPVNRREVKRGHDAAELLSKGTGGKAFVVDRQSDFSSALIAIGKALNGSCLLQYEASPVSDKNKLVPLHVSTTRKDVSLLAPTAH